MQYQTLQASPVTLLHDVGRHHYAPLQAYLAFLQDQFKRSPAELDLSVIDGFELVDGKLKINSINKTAINQAFMTMPEKAPYVLPEGLERDLNNNANRLIAGRKQLLQDEINTRIRDVQSHSQTMHNIFQSISRKRAELIAMEGGSFPLTDQIKAIGEAGFWKPIGYHSVQHTITLETAEDVWVKFNDVSAGVNKAYNAGKFKATIHLADGLQVRIGTGGAGNIIVRNNMHPHVSASGTLCLGNAQESYYQAVHELDLTKMLDITRIILTTYSPDNPYVSFDEFFQIFQRNQNLTLRTHNVANLNAQYAATIANSPDDLDWYDSTISNF